MNYFTDYLYCFIVFVSLRAILITGNYECICNYAVESTVYSRPDNSTAPLGLLYEFDCKALDRTLSNNQWWAIFFYHQIGYISATNKLMEQACTGSVPHEDVITSTLGPNYTTRVLTKASTILYGMSTTKPPTSFCPSNRTNGVQGNTAKFLSTLYRNFSTETFSSPSNTVGKSRRTTTEKRTSANTLQINTTDSFGHFVITTPHRLYSFLSSRLINSTSFISPTHSIQKYNITKSSILNTSSTNVFIYMKTSNLSYLKNISSSKNMNQYTSSPRTSTDVNVTSRYPHKNTTIGSFNVTNVNVSSTHLPRNMTSGSLTSTDLKVTSNNARSNVTLGIFSSTETVSKNIVQTDTVKTSDQVTQAVYQYTSTLSGYLVLNHTRASKSTSFQNIVTNIPSQRTFANSNTSNFEHKFDKTIVNNRSEVTTEVYETTVSQNQTAKQTTSNFIFTKQSGNITKDPMINESNNKPFTHTQTWNIVNYFTGNSVSQRLSTITNNANNTTEAGITTTTNNANGKETSESFTSNYGQETSHRQNTSPRQDAVSNTYEHNDQTTSIQSLPKYTTDKWTVELCPYYMLSKTIFNGTLVHPYPLVRYVGDYCYELSTDIDTWFNAISQCKERGGDLVMIKSKQVETTLLTMLRELNYTGEVWIGLTNLNEDGKWHWINGDQPGGSLFENWETTSYTDPVISLRRNCATMDYGTGKWRTRACQNYLFYTSKYHFICQYKVN